MKIISFRVVLELVFFKWFSNSISPDSIRNFNISRKFYSFSFGDNSLLFNKGPSSDDLEKVCYEELKIIQT